MTATEARDLLEDAISEHLERRVKGHPNGEAALNAFLSEPEAIEALLEAHDDGFPASKVWDRDREVVHARVTSAMSDVTFCGRPIKGDVRAYRWRVPEARVTCPACRHRLRVAGWGR